MQPDADLLAGVRVLDLTNLLAGPFAGYQLALMGADVIKVEVPGTGDLARSLGADPALSADGLGISFLAQNSAKRSITLDLKHARGREVFERLVGEADLLLENFRPGVLARLGFPVEVLRALNPGLVYCAVSGFGQTGPMRGRPAYDQIIQGLSGIMSVTGAPDSAPTRTGFPIADTLGGYAAAFAISAALVKRARTGDGSYLDVSMLETAVAATATIYAELGLPAELARGLFVLSRSVGLLAHAHEQQQEGTRIKGPIPKGVIPTYTGHPPRSLA
ncbi:CoA transferase [Kribbella sp. NPDC049174]|uniref:CoA transferase n=1 Tax=Kribbella sp. NPDC049174 TaxID=3364112 RepID=UPI0037154F23